MKLFKWYDYKRKGKWTEHFLAFRQREELFRTEGVYIIFKEFKKDWTVSWLPSDPAKTQNYVRFATKEPNRKNRIDLVKWIFTTEQLKDK